MGKSSRTKVDVSKSEEFVVLSVVMSFAPSERHREVEGSLRSAVQAALGILRFAQNDSSE